MPGLRVKFTILGVVFLAASLLPTRATAQGTDTALVRGTVSDPSSASIPGATVTMTNDGTKISAKATTDQLGRYIFEILKPASYTATVQAQGFKTEVRKNIVLRVGDQTDIDFTLQVGQTTQTVEVTSAAPLLNTVSAALGTEVTNRYIIEMPLFDRDISGLSYLAPGITEVAGGSIGMLGGTVFASNGQRYATAEIRVDGALATNPEGGEGGTTNSQYKPPVEALQEFKLVNNSLAAEYGNNGGTVINIITKSGTNQFHGSGFYFFRRPGLDSNDFFSNLAGQPKGPYAHDQYGGSIGGPIRKQKTFFFFDLEKTRNNSPFTLTTSVPTALQRQGNFSQTFNPDGSLEQIFNPCPKDPMALTDGCLTPTGTGDYTRQPLQYLGTPNVIPPTMIDPIAQAVINLYPPPTGSGDPFTGLNNYTQKLIEVNPGYSYDIRIDHDFSSQSRLIGRYSQSHSKDFVPDPFLAPNLTFNYTHDVSLEHNWTINPTMLWTNRISVHRGNFPQQVQQTVDPLKVGFPSILINNPWFNEKHFPNVSIDGYQGLATDACCTDTVEADTQWMINSVLTKIVRSHNLKFGVERRSFLNNFFQPDNTSGEFDFPQSQTEQFVFSPDATQGNSLASFLLGWGWGAVVARPHVANKSGEASFFAQDDWKVTNRLTLNLGLRYEYSIPYSERYNHNAFSCFSCDSGKTVPSVPGFFQGRELIGTTILAGPGHRHANIDWNNVAPRFGFAYRLNEKTVLRGGVGVYYGMNFATNWQYGGAAWNKDVNIYMTNPSDGITQYATLANPFPVGFVGPQQGKYGALTRWGFSDDNHGSDTFRNGEIYQWNIGIERQLPGDIIIDAHYSANRSTHLPWNYSTENRNFVSKADREKYLTAGLAQEVTNPFLSLFQGPNAIFNEPDSVYNNSTVQLNNLLRPYPQFPGNFSGFPLFAATSSYNSLQVRFEKRASHGISFLGNYTFSKFIDTSDAGGNAWIGSLGFIGTPQDFTNLKAEKSLSGNDTPQRLAFAVIYELPVGRGHALGRSMNRVLDGIVGGWRINSNVTFQSGQPIAIQDQNAQLADGVQRPSVTGNPRSQYSFDQIVASGGTQNFFNFDPSHADCSDPQHGAICHPGDQVVGSAPRYFSNVRAPGIHSNDTGIAKRFNIRESMYLDVRAEFFNFFNTPRFGFPGLSFGADNFGVISGQSNGPRKGQIGVRFIF